MLRSFASLITIIGGHSANVSCPKLELDSLSSSSDSDSDLFEKIDDSFLHGVDCGYHFLHLSVDYAFVCFHFTDLNTVNSFSYFSRMLNPILIVSKVIC